MKREGVKAFREAFACAVTEHAEYGGAVQLRGVPHRTERQSLVGPGQTIGGAWAAQGARVLSACVSLKLE